MINPPPSAILRPLTSRVMSPELPLMIPLVVMIPPSSSFRSFVLIIRFPEFEHSSVSDNEPMADIKDSKKFV